MKTIKSVEDATDAQLRQLAARYQWTDQYQVMIQSQLPLLTVERAQLVGLLKTNHIHEFMQ